MVDFEKIKAQIVEALIPLEPKKIILFGSYAYGTPNEDSDIDIFLMKDIEKNRARDLIVEARLRIRKLISKYKIGFDFIVASEEFINSRQDYFYQKDILEKGKVIYERDTVSNYADVNGLIDDFGYKPDTDLKDGIKEFVKWYRKFYGEEK